ncbi:hypothetical protein [Desulfobacca acetoxidans]|uniref:Uncharacterized protein n=1 Tax=Desulfobacca acetoxidans (strain ATCC 700848 / DSM 11109 / ASRB2) TaxID=880072 RepID=F2NG90_DESAR|nr:hypothetical protein [Desulfobacca acetoxidans]AEB08503.1 hypothetical protein Desac_0617 [Desulfobacca acetoxidans DSM 11109]
MTGIEIFFTALGSVVAALLAAYLGGRYTFRAVEKTFAKNLELQKVNQENIIKALLQAIHDEIETLWEHYSSELGAKIDSLPDNHPLNYLFPILQDYFTIYTGNAILIGHIFDVELRKSIVTTYTKARAMIDTIRLNNELVQKNEFWFRLYQQSKDPTLAKNVDDSWTLLIEYAKVIKKYHADMKITVNDLLRKLRKTGVLYQERQ